MVCWENKTISCPLSIAELTWDIAKATSDLKSKKNTNISGMPLLCIRTAGFVACHWLDYGVPGAVCFSQDFLSFRRLIRMDDMSQLYDEAYFFNCINTISFFFKYMISYKLLCNDMISSQINNHLETWHQLPSSFVVKTVQAITGLKYSCFLSSYPESNISYRIRKEAKLNKTPFFSTIQKY